VLELLEFCAKQGKHSINYVERTAFSFVESGVDTVEALKIKIAEIEFIKSNESFVRKLFGMKSRALTAKEKKCIEQWFVRFGYGEDVITRAYELTVAATNEPSVPYANAIIERWFSEGIKTVEDIDKAAEERAEAKKSEPAEGSFDTDECFELALRRSYDKK
jgi:DnaD/phage-associated family protein